MSATTTLILVIEQLITKIGDDDSALTASLNAVKAELATDEAAEAALADRVAKLEAVPASTPFDPSAIETEITALGARVTTLETTPPAAPDLTALTDRVTALEDRNTADDSAAAGLPPLTPPPAPTPLSLGAESAAVAVVGEDFSAMIPASGGTPPVAFSIASGALPDGLSMAAGGLITGTPTTAGTFAFSVQAHDANNLAVTGDYSIEVDEPAPAPVDTGTAPTNVDAPVVEPAPAA